ncbi:hypothetical protein U1Q18_052279 [Sarracenia purpurea var. burkii]
MYATGTSAVAPFAVTGAGEVTMRRAFQQITGATRHKAEIRVCDTFWTRYLLQRNDDGIVKLHTNNVVITKAPGRGGGRRHNTTS